MKHHPITGVLFAALATMASATWSDTTQWSTDGYEILRNGEPFFAKGVAYYPLPIGNRQKDMPYGDFFYNFEGQNPVWKNILDRDLPAMRRAGVNMIRLYAMWAWANERWEVMPLNVDKTRTLSHQKFLDMAWNNGVDPMHVLVTVFIESGSWQNTNYQAQIEDVYRQLASEMKDHPALMGFIVGNELNDSSTIQNPEFWAWLDRLGSIIKEEAPDKLVTTSLVDDGLASVRAGKELGPQENGVPLPNIDVWGLNIYRGNGTNGFTPELWNEFQRDGDRPLLFTEWGVPASFHEPDAPYSQGGIPAELPNRASAQSDWLVNHYEDMTDNSVLTGGLTSGGALFMWSDGWDKQGCNSCEPNVQDGSDGTGSFPGHWWDEEWFGINAVVKDPSRPWDENWNVAANRPWPADTLVPRAAYDSISRLFNDLDPEVSVRAREQPRAMAVFAQSFADIKTEGDGNGAILELAANGETVIGSGESFRLLLGVNPNAYKGALARWYLGATAYRSDDPEDFDVYHYSPSGNWKRASDQNLALPSTPAWEGPVSQLDNFEAYRGSLPPGRYDFNFALTTEEPEEGYRMFFDSTTLVVE
ncbi:hypothetical protein [Rhabdochromatium marinum]|uniref:hypothetical protein n=1 Tax=Rhabdochromatium marinum TaxID=48729 RepID=UPI001903ACF6|nr:hypothetical protein [Rhabdochromatium marinum]MBK1648611.1 hypothetical protein [Rhabdochromatium marinum]